MGGLSAGAFLAREGKTALILEKHNKKGGYVSQMLPYTISYLSFLKRSLDSRN